MIKTVVLLIFTVTAFVFCMQAGFVSLLTWIWLSVMMPQSEAWASPLLNYSNFIAGALTIIALISSKEKKHLPVNGFTVLFFIFSAIIILSQLFSLNSDLSYPHFRLGVVTLFMTYAIIMLANTKVKIQALLWVYVLSVGYFGVTRGLYTIASGGAAGITGAAGTVLLDNNHLAVGLAMVAPLAQYLYLTSMDKRARLLAAGIFTLSIIAVIGSHSRGGLISLGVLCLALIMRSQKKLLNFFIVTIVAGSAFLMMPPEYFGRMETISSAEEDSSFMGRVEAWEVAYKLGLENPFLGLGARLQYFPEYNWHVAPAQSIGGQPYTHRATHNAYLEIFAGNGLLAFGAFVGMMAISFFWCGKIKKLTRHKAGFLWADNLASMLQISLVVFGVGTMALSMEFWVGFWIHMVLVLNLREIVLRELKTVPVAKKQVAYA